MYVSSWAMEEGGHAPSAKHGQPTIRPLPNRRQLKHRNDRRRSTQGTPLTDMAPVLCPGHVPIHPEPPVDAADLLPLLLRGHEGAHARPQRVVEGLVDDPVEVVREHARVFALGAQRRVGDEGHGFAGGDDGGAFGGGEDVADEAEVGDEGVRLDGRGRAGRGGERDGVVG